MTAIAAGGMSNIKVTGKVESVGAVISVMDFSTGYVYDYYPTIEVLLTAPVGKAEISKGGDSGIVLLQSPSLRPVGIVFANAGKYGYAIPIAAVISSFSLSAFVP